MKSKVLHLQSVTELQLNSAGIQFHHKHFIWELFISDGNRTTLHFLRFSHYCLPLLSLYACHNIPFLWLLWHAWNTASCMDSMAKHKWAGLRQEETDLRPRVDFFMVAWNLKGTGIQGRNRNRKDVKKRGLWCVIMGRLPLTAKKSSLAMTFTQCRQREGCYWCHTMEQYYLRTRHQNQSLKKPHKLLLLVKAHGKFDARCLLFAES